MGVSIDTHTWTREGFRQALYDCLGGEPGPDLMSINEFIEKVTPHFGTWYGDTYVCIWNEYYEECNPATQLLSFIRRYYNVEDAWLNGYDYGVSGASAGEVLEELFPDEEFPDPDYENDEYY